MLGLFGFKLKSNSLTKNGWQPITGHQNKSLSLVALFVRSLKEVERILRNETYVLQVS